ncbi:ABC transporter permease [Roseicitreum antarcticum]|uniref:Nucleoside ABC transporter membrane protein n=1 Tax=Roseicitreum antarcticum TaxID=564137 RepID=A0A1H2ZD62_9RHOB|nr:ABC transporter permease [Roseicitreum antarcticum]SDX15432.1 nucleoside ABC transporter membrane protein [Roseicitreum antarcticum]
MPLRLVPRMRPSPLALYGAPVLALGLTVAFGFVLFLSIGRDPWSALYAYFIAPINSVFGLSELLLAAMPLALIGLGLAVGFRANIWNIGAEGQLVLGAIGGGTVALALWREGVPGTFVLVCIVGALSGMAWAAIPALLRTRFNANEILTSLMLIYVADQLLGWLVHGALRNPQGFGFPESRLFSPEALMPLLWSGTRLHIGWLLVPLAAIGIWFLMTRTVTGFRLRVGGDAANAAAYAGFSQNRMVWLSFLLTGGLAGLVGAMEVAGPVGQLLPKISPGYGFAAIIVAFLGRLHPVGVVLAAHLLALIMIGGENAQMLGVPVSVAELFQGVLLVTLLASDVLVRFRIVRTGARARKVVA